MQRFDIAIIGTGPAGLEAALTAKARNKNILVLGSATSSEKVRKAHSIMNYLGLPAISGADMQKRFLGHAQEMGVEICDEKATMVFPQTDYFSLQTDKGFYEAQTVILATGMAPSNTYPGEEEFLGRGVSYCATCDAALYRGKTAAIIAASPDEEAEADFLAEFAEKVHYFPLYKGEVQVKEGIEVHRERPQGIVGQMKATALQTDAASYEVDGIFVLRESVAPTSLVPGLQMDGNHVAVDRSMATNVEGLFAAGDITGAPYQYIKSAGEGNVAALSAASLIDARNRARQA